MSLDKFDRYYHFHTNKRKNNLKKHTDSITFTIDHDKNIIMHNKRIKKLKSPTEGSDAVNKDFFIDSIK